MNMMNASEVLLHSTIRIECDCMNGQSTGTGFFFQFLDNKEEGKSVPVIVTNKHVVKNASIGILRFSLNDEKDEKAKDKYCEVRLDRFEARWIMHPEDNVDLCILPIASICEDLASKGYSIQCAYCNMDVVPTQKEIEEQITCIEDITVIGYPDGIWDEVNNRPIVRRGITATSLQLDFNGKPDFLIDAAIFGGSSGSPVFLFNQGAFPMPNGGICAGSRIKLVGIVRAVAQHTTTGEFRIIDIPTVQKPISVTPIPNNLGVVIHARKLRAFETLLEQIIAKNSPKQ